MTFQMIPIQWDCVFHRSRFQESKLKLYQEKSISWKLKWVSFKMVKKCLFQTLSLRNTKGQIFGKFWEGCLESKMNSKNIFFGCRWIFEKFKKRVSKLCAGISTLSFQEKLWNAFFGITRKFNATQKEEKIFFEFIFDSKKPHFSKILTFRIS